MSKLYDTNQDDKMAKFRNIIVGKLCECDELTSLLGGEDVEDNAELVWERIFPLEYVPDVTENTGPYLCFDINIDDYAVDTFQVMSVYFFACAGYTPAAQRSPFGTGLVCDDIVHRIRGIFDDKLITGVGKFKFMSNHIYSPHDDFRGRVIRYDVRDFNYGV